MTEPGDLTLVLIGSLTNKDPWDLEIWARDDINHDGYDPDGNPKRWHRTSHYGDDETACVSWQWLETYARDRSDKLTNLGTGAP